MYSFDQILVLVQLSFLWMNVKTLLVIGFTNINWKVFKWWSVSSLQVIHSFILLHKFFSNLLLILEGCIETQKFKVAVLVMMRDFEGL